MNSHDDTTTFLRIYLQDHVAVATAGSRRAARLAHAEAHASDAAVFAKLADDIATDRAALLAMMGPMGFAPSRWKTSLASIGERLGLLKLNGRLLTRSPLSTIVELEVLQMVVREQRSLWETLQAIAPERRPADLDGLIARADDQLEMLTGLHRARVASTFAVSTAPPTRL